MAAAKNKLLCTLFCPQLVGVYLTIWVKAQLLPHVKAVQATHVATGFIGYLGNKGAFI